MSNFACSDAFFQMLVLAELSSYSSKQKSDFYPSLIPYPNPVPEARRREEGLREQPNARRARTESLLLFPLLGRAAVGISAARRLVPGSGQLVPVPVPAATVGAAPSRVCLS